LSPLEEIGETQVLAALLGIGEMIGELTDTEEILASIVRIAPSLVRVDRCAIFAYDETAREFRVLAAFTPGTPKAAFDPVRLAEADMPRLAQRLVGLRLPALVKDSSKEIALPPGVMRRLHAKAVLLVPLVCRGRLLGCLWLDRVGTSHYFTSREINILQGIATEVAIVMDNAERLRELDTARRSFETLARALSDGVVIVTPELHIQSLDAGAEALLGWTSAEARGRRVEEVLDISDAEATVAWRKAKSGPTPTSKEVFLRARDGLRIPCEVLAIPVKGEKGEVTHVLYVLRSLTSRKEPKARASDNPREVAAAHVGSPRE